MDGCCGQGPDNGLEWKMADDRIDGKLPSAIIARTLDVGSIKPEE